jgi:hypothetical protein
MWTISFSLCSSFVAPKRTVSINRSNKISLLEVLSTCVLKVDKLNLEKKILTRKYFFKLLYFILAFLYLIANSDAFRAPTERKALSRYDSRYMPGVC